MKKFKLSLVAVAIILGAAGAVSVKANEIAAKSGQAWFYNDGNDGPGEKVLTSTPNCTEASPICAQLYNLDESGQPTGEAVDAIQGTRQ